nr:16S rRNA (uracil(1498)-N(3))-methyltransferase [Clostridia bacterium]
MQRFFLSHAGHIDGDLITVTGDDARHISRSLRMIVGDTVIICDMQKNEYECRIEAFVSDDVLLRIVKVSQNATEPDYRAYLYQALPKGDKFDLIVQKAVELGVHEIIPFVSERCIVREAKANKLERWRRIAYEAAKQCGRGIIPEVREVLTYDAMLRECASDGEGEHGFGFMCYEGDGTLPLTRLLDSVEDGTPSKVLRFIIGSEGGFSLRETEKAKDMGLRLAGLGRRILRCETASGFVLSALVARYELC